MLPQNLLLFLLLTVSVTPSMFFKINLLGLYLSLIKLKKLSDKFTCSGVITQTIKNFEGSLRRVFYKINKLYFEKLIKKY